MLTSFTSKTLFDYTPANPWMARPGDCCTYPPQQQPPHMQLAHHGPLVSHAAAAIMQSPALVTPAGSPASGHHPPPHHHHAAVSSQPCSTLFIANLGHSVAEHELKDIFSRYARKVRAFLLTTVFLLYYTYLYIQHLTSINLNVSSRRE